MLKHVLNRIGKKYAKRKLINSRNNAVLFSVKTEEVHVSFISVLSFLLVPLPPALQKQC